MTGFSPTLMHNAVGYDGLTPVARTTLPPKNLRGEYNRGFWLDWSVVEQIEGKPDWSVPDAWVWGNLKQDRKPIAVLCGHPTWALASKARWELFESYCFTLQARYGSDLARVELGNEFDTAPNLGYAQPDEIVRLWHVGHGVFKERSILGNIQSLSHQGEGLHRLAAALGAFVKLAGPPRAVSVHLYDTLGLWGPGMFERMLHEVRGVLIAHGAPRSELWVTEFGVWREQVRDESPQFADWNEREQGAWLRAAMRAMRAAGVEHALYWELDNPDRQNGGFGWDSAAVGKRVWNEAVTAVAR